MRDQLPRGLRKGRIVRRQTTFWEVDSGNKTWRIKFKGTQEVRFAAPSFAGATISTDHPILGSFVEGQQRLFVSSEAGAVSETVGLLEEAISVQTGGWRSLAEFANPDVLPADILRSGRGMLLEGPCSVVDAAKVILRNAGVRHESLESGRPRLDARALILGKNFVVAEHFEFETTPAV